MKRVEDSAQSVAFIVLVVVWLGFLYGISDWIGRENVGEVIARRSLGQLLVSPGLTILGLFLAIGMTVQYYRQYKRD